MVLSKLVSMIYNFIGRGRPRIKEASASCGVIEVNVEQKVEESLAESAAESIGGEGEFCCVCLSRLKDREETDVLPCLHEFHKECIERWFSSCRKTCPICRFSMEEEKCYFAEEVLTEEMLIYFSSFHAAGF